MVDCFCEGHFADCVLNLDFMGKPHLLSERSPEEEGEAPGLLSTMFFSENPLLS